MLKILLIILKKDKILLLNFFKKLNWKNEIHIFRNKLFIVLILIWP